MHTASTLAESERGAAARSALVAIILLITYKSAGQHQHRNMQRPFVTSSSLRRARQFLIYHLARVNSKSQLRRLKISLQGFSVRGWLERAAATD